MNRGLPTLELRSHQFTLTPLANGYFASTSDLPRRPFQSLHQILDLDQLGQGNDGLLQGGLVIMVLSMIGSLLTLYIRTTASTSILPSAP